MRKTILTILGAALVAASTVQVAAAAERHHPRKIVRAPVSEPFRNANDAIGWPAQPGPYLGYTEGHVISAPAGR
jgi:hypothetical protein